ncbi:hypothetical protein CYMTET_14503 [Cymbomonas tetramitiformis]|uniref:EF-hand domain-containing protein n=1 Tax=Cymbomonas tetramitiformis TaxID=36881 RepID=A0AAE0L9V3_9CHLO|nr:hypothetical protein CYMTET_14503 [Cymbomonas tetramitiformis]
MSRDLCTPGCSQCPGTVDFDEFVEWWSKHGDGLIAAGRPEDWMLRKLFNEVDADRSGEIDAMEFVALCQKLGIDSKEDALDFFAEIDVDDSDGTRWFSRSVLNGGDLWTQEAQGIALAPILERSMLASEFVFQFEIKDMLMDCTKGRRKAATLYMISNLVTKYMNSVLLEDCAGCPDDQGTIDFAEFANCWQTYTASSADSNEDLLLINIFNDIDKDRSGRIDRSEFVAFSRKLGITSTEEALGYFAEIDHDNSGTIDFAEFVDWWPQCGADIRQEDLLLINLFDEIDSDQSGEIDAAEFVALCAKLGIDSTEEALRYFAEIDDDSSGTIDFLEFYDWWPTSLLNCYSTIKK